MSFRAFKVGFKTTYGDEVPSLHAISQGLLYRFCDTIIWGLVLPHQLDCVIDELTLSDYD